MFLYIDGRCIGSEYFKENMTTGLDDKLLGFVVKLKNEDRKKNQ
jgi:uncharacterized protein (UPF0335 family)